MTLVDNVHSLHCNHVHTSLHDSRNASPRRSSSSSSKFHTCTPHLKGVGSQETYLAALQWKAMETKMARAKLERHTIRSVMAHIYTATVHSGLTSSQTPNVSHTKRRAVNSGPGGLLVSSCKARKPHWPQTTSQGRQYNIRAVKRIRRPQPAVLHMWKGWQYEHERMPRRSRAQQVRECTMVSDR